MLSCDDKLFLFWTSEKCNMSSFLTRSWKCPSLNKYWLTCRVTFCNVLYEAYSELFHIQNADKFRAQDIFRTMSGYILSYSKRCLKLAFWETFHIQNLNPVYLGILEHILAYSIMIVIIALNFFFHFNLAYFPT